MAMLAREAALLYALHQQLHMRWSLAPTSSVDVSAFAANLSQVVSYRLPDDATVVDVRAIAVGDKLYVHIVDSSDHATRVDLAIHEYVHENDDTSSTKTLGIDRWRVNTELLRWRLERVVYPLFDDRSSGKLAQAAADAELGRLPETLVSTLSSFLTGPEFSHVTQTNQYLHKFDAHEELWISLLRRDFPGAAIPSPGAKSKYIAKHCDLNAHRRAIADSCDLPFFQFLPTGPPVLPRMPDLFPPPQRGPWLPRAPGLGSNLPPFMRSGYDDDRFPP
ncbi:hypothetical protein PINS_up018326 [Pythium insidiosum]|nr:hypothetical protein PINS_up018326 [Pythium insidiosum]